VTSPVSHLSSSSGNNHAKNSTINSKVATKFTALQEYLYNEGLRHHPPFLKRPPSTNGLEQALFDFTDVDVSADDQYMIYM